MSKKILSLLLCLSMMMSLFTVTGFSATAAGSNDNDIDYSDLENPENPKLASIAITSLPDKTDYFVGDRFDDTGLAVEAVYINDRKEPLAPSDYTVTPTQLDTVGVTTLTVTYKEKKATFDVNVAAVELDYIEVYRKPSELDYIQGDELDTYGMDVIAYYNNDDWNYIADYEVKANLNEAGQQTVTVSYQEKEATFTVNVAALGQPAVKVANSATGITVSWNKITNATKGYYIYRRQLDNGKWSGWKQLKGRNASATSWVDTSVKAGVDYRYTVRAVRGTAKSTYAASAIVRRLATPQVTVSNSASGITVKWNKIAGANTGYYIYRRQLNSGKWSGWKCLKGRNASATSWVDTSAKAGVTYSYTVRAVSGDSMSIYVSSAKVPRLATPKVTVAKSAKGITVKWNKIAAADTGYYIYRRQLNGGKWSGWKRLKGRNAAATSWVDTSAKAGVTYSYTVRAVSGSHMSAYVASAKVKR